MRRGYTGIAELTLLSSVEYDSRSAVLSFIASGQRKLAVFAKANQNL
jgi:hypothetical protein